MVKASKLLLIIAIIAAPKLCGSLGRPGFRTPQQEVLATERKQAYDESMARMQAFEKDLVQEYFDAVAKNNLHGVTVIFQFNRNFDPNITRNGQNALDIATTKEMRDLLKANGVVERE